MSFIHDVLQRLDARGAAPPALAGMPPTVHAANAGASKRLLATGVIGAAAIGFAAFGDWPNWLRRTAAAPRPALTTPAGQPAGTVTAAPVAAGPGAAGPGAEAAASSAPSATAMAPAAGATPGAPSPEAARTAAPAPRATARAPAERARVVAARQQPAGPDDLGSQQAGEIHHDAARIDKRSIAQTGAQRALLLLRQAHDAAQAGQPRAAIDKAREALALDASLSSARLLAALLEHETGASDRAGDLLRDGLARDPRDAALALALARVTVAQGDAAGALAVLERYPVRGAEADGLRGGILTQQGDSARALPAYESAARQQPANPMWWLGLGVALDAERQPQRARQAYARALSLGLPRDDLTLYAEQRLRAAE